MTLADACRAALNSANVRAFLRVIRAGESSQDDTAYRMMVGGSLFDGFEAHPNVVVRVPRLPPSTAAGAYQFLHRTWLECRDALRLPDFSPASQDLAAVYLIQRRGALDDVKAGRIESAIRKCNQEWASLPGSPYGQPTRTLSQALSAYAQYGGTLAGAEAPITPESVMPAEPEALAITRETAPPTKKGWSMAPILAALLPSLVSAIPRLASIFTPGSPVAERNVKAVTTAFEIAKDALGAANEQEVVQRVQSDPAAAQTVTQAIESRWIELTEAGGGGIEGARKADAEYSSGRADFLHSPSFWVGLALLPLVYMIVANLIGILGSSTWSDDARSALAGSIVGSIIGGLVGYYFGQSTSRNRAPA